MPGPWGSYKTFVAIDLAVSVMRRNTFAGRAINKRCGVLFIAAEGAYEIPIRLQAAYEEGGLDDDSPLPFARADQCPRLLDKNALAILKKTADEAVRHMKERHGVELGLIMIDTMAAAAGFDDENSNSETQRAMNLLKALAEHAKCCVLVVDHFGKSAETGTRGGSAKEASADAVLAILADRDLSGKVSNPRMAIRKVRGAPGGTEIPFATRVVDLGLDKNGQSQSTLVIQWKVEGSVLKAADPWPLNFRVFKDALSCALTDHGQDQRPWIEGPMVRAVDAEHVRTEFYRLYPVEGDTKDKRQAAQRKAFGLKMEGARERRLIGTVVAGGLTLVWDATNQRDGQDKTLTPALSVPFSGSPNVTSAGTSVSPRTGQPVPLLGPPRANGNPPALGPPGDSLDDFYLGGRR